MINLVLQPPSLRHLAAVQVVAALFNQRHVLAKIEQKLNGIPCYGIRIRPTDMKWLAIDHKKVMSNVSALELPQTCKKELLNFIVPIEMEIINWCCYHYYEWATFHCLENILPRQFFWTMHGTVDYARTAALMVNDESVDVEKRFVIACLNCLEDDARQLLPFVPNQRIQQFMSDAADNYVPQQRNLIAYFARTLSVHFNGANDEQLNELFRKRLTTFESINYYLCVVSLRTGTRATCHYFFQKLSPAEEEMVFANYCTELTCHDENRPTCGLMYMLSLLNEEQRGHNHNMTPRYISSLLMGLLRWPMQSLFMESAKRDWQFLQEDSGACAKVLRALIDLIRFGFADYAFAQWFWKCWGFSSAEQKQHFLNNIARLKNLLATKQEDFIKLVLNEAPWRRLKQLIENDFATISEVLMDKEAISDAALLDCKEKAVLIISSDPQSEIEQRWRSEYLIRLIDMWDWKRRLVDFYL